MNPSDTELNVHFYAASGDAWILTAHGAIDFSTSEYFERRWKELLQKKPAHLLIDAADVHYISSIGLSAVIGLYKQCQDSAVSFAVYDPMLTVKRVLEISKMDFLILQPDKIGSDSPFWAYIQEEEPERQKRRKEVSARKRPPRLYSD